VTWHYREPAVASFRLPKREQAPALQNARRGTLESTHDSAVARLSQEPVDWRA
jgi:hypothetical protein